MRKVVVALLVAIIGATGVRAGAHQGSHHAMWIPDLATRADVIVIADVGDVRSQWNASRTMILTTIELDVREALKGAIPDDRLTVTELGGQVGDISSVVPDAPQFRPGERALLFLTCRPDSRLAVTGLWQGKFEIETDTSGETRAIRRLPGSRTILNAIPLAAARALIPAHPAPGAPTSCR